MATTIIPSGEIVDLYRYNITIDVNRRTAPTEHLSNLRFRLWRRDPEKDPNIPVDDTHVLVADQSECESPITFPVSASTDYFIRVTKPAYKRSERNLGWRYGIEHLPLIYGEGYGIIQGPNRIYSEDIAPGGIFEEEYLKRWGRFQILMDIGSSTGTGSGVLILDKGFGIKTLACSGKYTFDIETGEWVEAGEEYTHTKVEDLANYLLYHYGYEIPLTWIQTYKEWKEDDSGERFLTFYPTKPGNPGTPSGNENNFQMWIMDENDNQEAEAFQYYIDPEDEYFNNPLNPNRFEIEFV